MVPADFVRQCELAFKAWLRICTEVNTQMANRTLRISLMEVDCRVIFEVFIVVLLMLEAMLVCWFVGVRIVPSPY